MVRAGALSLNFKKKEIPRILASGPEVDKVHTYRKFSLYYFKLMK